MATFEIDLTSELDFAIEWTKQHERQLPFSASQALNASVQGLRAVPGSKQNNALTKLADTSKQYLDRPKPQTQKGFRATVAKKQNIETEILPKDKPWKRNRYLLGNVIGGQRAPKPFEAAFSSRAVTPTSSSSKFVPTGALKPDKFGNVRRSQISKILDDVDTKGRRTTFIGKPRGGDRPFGVYRRQSRYKLRPLFLLDQSISYEPRFPAVKISLIEVQRTFGPYLRRQLAKNVADKVAKQKRGSF